jgi:hypothetical protein
MVAIYAAATVLFWTEQIIGHLNSWIFWQFNQRLDPPGERLNSQSRKFRLISRGWDYQAHVFFAHIENLPNLFLNVATMQHRAISRCTRGVIVPCPRQVK